MVAFGSLICVHLRNLWMASISLLWLRLGRARKICEICGRNPLPRWLPTHSRISICAKRTSLLVTSSPHAFFAVQRPNRA